MPNVPLVDLTIQHEEIADDVVAGWQRVVERAEFILGEDVGAFEAEFARFTGTAHCVGVGNGTDALELALRAAGVRAGDEVVLPANTFVATALAVVRMGGVPRLADVDPLTLQLDPTRLPDAIGERTRAILPVHLYGHMAEIEPIVEIARRIDAVVIEDCAQAQGAARSGTNAGTSGHLAATSFYPSKNLGAYGDGGAVLTDDTSLAAQVRALRDYGRDGSGQSVAIGFNSRLDTFQAVVLRAKLGRLAGWNDLRRAAAARYTAALEDVGGVMVPSVALDSHPVWHLYVIRIAADRRDHVLASMRASEINTAVHYPLPIHLQPAFRSLGYTSGDFPVAEEAAREILSLPIYPGITPAQQEDVVAALQQSLD